MDISVVGRDIIQRLHNSKYILLISHEHADGDSLGAALALAHYLHDRGLSYVHYTPCTIADYFTFLPKSDGLCYELNTALLEDFDTIVTLDCGGLNQTKMEGELITYRDAPNGKMLINIDHHASNTHFGNVNLVVTTASSTSEIVYKMLLSCDIMPTKAMATCLMTGLVTDTMNFTNGATTDGSLKAASDLLMRGARMKDIHKHVVQNKNVLALRLWGQILSRLQIDEEHGVAYTVILQRDIAESGAAESAIDGLTNFLNMLDGIDVIMVLREQENGWIKGSFRTTKDTVDVSKLAAKLGGGGHKKASGFKFQGHIVERDGQWDLVTNALS